MGVKFFYDLVIIHANLAELGVKSGQSGGKFQGPAILFNARNVASKTLALMN